MAGQFPPLAGNRDLFLSHDFPAFVVLYGLEGPLDVGGKRFEGVMPPFGHLTDQQIAAIIGHVRSSWGNAALRPKDSQAITPADVAKLRKKPHEAGDVAKLRRSLKK